MIHVEEEHLSKAVPVKRKDVPLLQRAEDATSLQGLYQNPILRHLWHCALKRALFIQNQ